MKFITLIAALWGLALFTSCGGRGPVLNIEGGQLTGVKTESDGVMVYKGIPYAAPPVGELRWRAPQSVIPWEGVKRADTFGFASMQPSPAKGSFYGKEFSPDGRPLCSEDCLYLNVWTPAAGETNAKLPVAMWIHGGGYTRGSGHEIAFDGEKFAQRGVILVSINYRLGQCGFMAHPLLTAENPDHTSGNYGLLDQRAALMWVRNNIAQFGGDPENITVFGQSTGAGCVQSLVVSPQTKELISKAVIQSAGGLRGLGSRVYSLIEAETNGKTLMDFAGLTSLDSMRAYSAEKLCDLSTTYTLATRRSVRTLPNIDGVVSQSTFHDAALEGNLADIPYMIGYTEGDSGQFKESVDDFALLLEQQERHAAYVYNFTRSLPVGAGAFHSAELWYVFGTLDRGWRPFTKADYVLSDRMINYWTNFIKTGNPNGPNLDPWQPYTEETPEIHKLDIVVTARK